MIQPVALQDFFITFFSSALIIVSGASYALFFVWSKKNVNSFIKLTMYLSYLILLISVFILSQAANFSGAWFSLSVAMAIGYFFAPIGIWYLCVKTHTDSHSLEENL